jgi:hypothetical protein
MDSSQEASLVLITGNTDFAYVLATLRLRKFRVIVISPSVAQDTGLNALASVFIDWNSQIIGKNSTRRTCSHCLHVEGVTSSSSRDQPSVSPTRSQRVASIYTRLSNHHQGYAHETGGLSESLAGLAGQGTFTQSISKSAANDEENKLFSETGAAFSRGEGTGHHPPTPSKDGNRDVFSNSQPPDLHRLPSLGREGHEGIAKRRTQELVQARPTAATSTDSTPTAFSLQSPMPHAVLTPSVSSRAEVPRDLPQHTSATVYAANQKPNTGWLLSREIPSAPVLSGSSPSTTTPPSHSQPSSLLFGSIPKSPDADDHGNLSNCVMSTSHRESSMSDSPSEMRVLSGGVKLGPGPMPKDNTRSRDDLDKPESKQVTVDVKTSIPPSRIDVSTPSSTSGKVINTKTPGTLPHRVCSHVSNDGW